MVFASVGCNRRIEMEQANSPSHEEIDPRWQEVSAFWEWWDSFDEDDDRPASEFYERLERYLAARLSISADPAAPPDQPDAHDQQDDLTDDKCVAVQRDRAMGMLNQIAQQAKAALDEQGLNISLFFLVPHSGDAIITFGTSDDPSDDEWDRVEEIVGSIVGQSIGLDRVRCRSVASATTRDRAA
jgi:hypothetical protein